jgi:ABC-type Na+ efflux pump permease subunit
MSPSTQSFTRFLPGATLAVIGSLAAIAGGGVLAAFGTDGTLNSGPHLVSTPAAALVSSVTKIKNTSGVATITGQPTLRVSVSPVQGTTAAFVGIGRAADVDRYLARVSTEEVSSLSSNPYSVSGIRHAGEANAQPPATQHFWAAQASSTHATEINWKIRDGQYRVVIMSANGHAGFATTSAIAVTLPHIARYALAALLLGLLMAGGGTALLIRASGRPRSEQNSIDPAPRAAATTV